MSRLPYLSANVDYWSSRTAGELDLARRRWAATEPCWGVYDIPESVARVLPADVAGLRVAELGCGTGYVSAWLARAGARPVAIDPTPSQLHIAGRMQDETGLGMYDVRWPDDTTVEFHLSPGDWIRLLRRHGFEVLDLIELYAADDETRDPMCIPPSWAQRWPVEEVWRARREPAGWSPVGSSTRASVTIAVTRSAAVTSKA